MMGDNMRIHPAAEHIKSLPLPPAASALPEGTYFFQPQHRRGNRKPGYYSPPHLRPNSGSCGFWCLGVLAVFLMLLIVAIPCAAFYFLDKPHVPRYDVEHIGVNQFFFDKDDSLIAEFNLTIRAVNSNKQMGVYYRKTNRVAVLYAGKELCTGSFSAFYQGYHNTTNLKVGVAGSRVRILQGLRSNLDAEQRKGKVPLVVAVDVPAKIKVGRWKSPEIVARLRCRLTVNKLAAKENVKITDSK
ncbi:hypothetical protein KI387_032391, partial [Taxus chinensis]